MQGRAALRVGAFALIGVEVKRILAAVRPDVRARASNHVLELFLRVSHPPALPEQGPFDPEVLNRMRTIVRVAISARSQSVREAAAEARGFARARHPGLPTAAIEDAVNDILRECDAYQPPSATLEHDGKVLRITTPEEVADSLSYAMRFNHRGRANRTGWEHAAALAANNLVHHLSASGYVVLKTSKPDAWEQQGE